MGAASAWNMGTSPGDRVDSCIRSQALTVSVKQASLTKNILFTNDYIICVDMRTWVEKLKSMKPKKAKIELLRVVIPQNKCTVLEDASDGNNAV